MRSTASEETSLYKTAPTDTLHLSLPPRIFYFYFIVNPFIYLFIYFFVLFVILFPILVSPDRYSVSSELIPPPLICLKY